MSDAFKRIDDRSNAQYEQNKTSNKQEAKGYPVDLTFVIDTTGSMSDKIEGLLKTCARFIDEFAALELDGQIGLVAFGDLRVPGDKIQPFEFTADMEITKQRLKNIPRFGGGGNEGESSLEALDSAIKLNYRPNAVKVIVLITDEPAHTTGQITIENISGRFAKQEFLVFVVSPLHEYFMDFAHKNGGRWYKISAETDFTNALEIFRQVAKRIVRVASDVHRLAGGSVSTYLQLTAPKR